MVCERRRASLPSRPSRRLNPCFSGIWSVSGGGREGVRHFGGVLILVLVEYGLWAKSLSWETTASAVLILVLVEYGLWDYLCRKYRKTPRPCLNPCFSGIWSVSWRPSRLAKFPLKCLNPCFSGIWSVSTRSPSSSTRSAVVLILVLVEYGLWASQRCRQKAKVADVLILVLVEYGLWVVSRDGSVFAALS